MRERKRERTLKTIQLFIKTTIHKSFQYYWPQLNIKINIFPGIHEKNNDKKIKWLLNSSLLYCW